MKENQGAILFLRLVSQSVKKQAIKEPQEIKKSQLTSSTALMVFARNVENITNL
jgi:hypothetical protein